MCRFLFEVKEMSHILFSCTCKPLDLVYLIIDHTNNLSSNSVTTYYISLTQIQNWDMS